MYRLHIGNKNYSSWSLRPWILMTELGIGFEEAITPFDEGSNWKKFRSFSPNGMVPCLIDTDNDFPIWDTLAISEYLADNNKNVWPDNASARAWARCASAEMHSGFSQLRNLCPMNCALRIELYDMVEPLKSDLERIEELWTQGLNLFSGPYLAGDKYSAVDAFYAPVVFRIRTYGFTFNQQVTEYIERILSLNSMKKWDQQAIAEQWLELQHEKEAIESGKIVKDYRNK